MEMAAKTLGVTDGAFKGDLIVDKNGRVRILEVTARTSGGFDSQLRKPLSFGIDILKATIDIALGRPLDPIDLIPKWVKWSSTISIFPKPGVVTAITGLNKIKKMKSVKDLVILTKVGEKIDSYSNSAKRTNFITLVADTFEELVKNEKFIYNNLVIQTTNEKK